jgi:hypothetical protein
VGAGRPNGSHRGGSAVAIRSFRRVSAWHGEHEHGETMRRSWMRRPESPSVPFRLMDPGRVRSLLCVVCVPHSARRCISHVLTAVAVLGARVACVRSWLQRSVRGAKNKRQLATQNVFPAYTSVRYTCVRDHARDINSNMSDYLFIQNLHICSVAWTAQNSPSYHLGGRYSVSACACARTVCYLSAVVAHIAFAANCQSPASGPQG